MRKTNYITVLFLSLLLSGCSDSGRQSDDDRPSLPFVGDGREDADKKTCVEAPPVGNIKACFATPGEYGRFKTCYNNTGALAKCYLKRNECGARRVLVDDVCTRQCVGHAELGADGECHPLPVACPEGEGWTRDESGHCSEVAHTVPLQPEYPIDKHFQFDYIVRPLTDDQRNRIRNGVLDLKTLVNGEPCRFVATNASANNAAHVRQRGTTSAGDPVYSITLQIGGNAAGCSGGRATRFQAELRDVVSGHNGLTNLDHDPLAFVVSTLSDYRLTFEWPPLTEEFAHLPAPVIYFNMSLPAYDGIGHPLNAEFEFLAQEDGNPGTYLLGFYGHMLVE